MTDKKDKRIGKSIGNMLIYYSASRKHNSVED